MTKLKTYKQIPINKSIDLSFDLNGLADTYVLDHVSQGVAPYQRIGRNICITKIRIQYRVKRNGLANPYSISDSQIRIGLVRCAQNISGAIPNYEDVWKDVDRNGIVLAPTVYTRRNMDNAELYTVIYDKMHYKTGTWRSSSNITAPLNLINVKVNQPDVSHALDTTSTFEGTGELELEIPDVSVALGGTCSWLGNIAGVLYDGVTTGLPLISWVWGASTTNPFSFSGTTAGNISGTSTFPEATISGEIGGVAGVPVEWGSANYEEFVENQADSFGEIEIELATPQTYNAAGECVHNSFVMFYKCDVTATDDWEVQCNGRICYYDT